MSEELVLCVPRARLESLGNFIGLATRVKQYLPALLESAHLKFHPRSRVETDPTWLQLIPYVVLRHGDQIFHYTRGSAGGEKRLHALRSIGIGGHINPVDADRGDPYRAGLLRELFEEVEIVGPDSESVLGLVHDPSTPVGQVHLGIVHVWHMTNGDVKARDSGITNTGFASVEASP